jgi:hypothetical protein
LLVDVERRHGTQKRDALGVDFVGYEDFQRHLGRR